MLNIVSTPIGNLNDITLRALEVLKSSDVVVCEDTRVTRKLLDHFDIKKLTVSLHQHSTDEKINSILEKYENIAYVTDAGTPGISDPGNKVVELAIAKNITVTSIPGASSLTFILSVAGMPTDKFIFLGFMPRKGQQKTFNLIKDSEITVCFFESPHRIIKTLEKLQTELSDSRQIVVGRELTKKFETIYRGNVSKVLAEVKDKVRGEFVVVISGKKKRLDNEVA